MASFFSQRRKVLGANPMEKLKIFPLQKKEKFEKNDSRPSCTRDIIPLKHEAQGFAGKIKQIFSLKLFFARFAASATCQHKTPGEA